MSDETKEQRFERIAAKRVEGVVKALDILGRCSVRGQYQYTPQQVDAIFIELDRKLDAARKKFLPVPESDVYSFCFEKEPILSDIAPEIDAPRA